MGKEAARTAAAQPDQAPEASFLPMFYSHPMPVNPARHDRAGLRLNLPMDFARNTNSLVITAAEFAEAAKWYPIVFTAQDPIAPLVIVGLEKENYYIGEDGKWRSDTYIPAYVRQYPFVFMETPGSDQLVLCVEEDAPHFIAQAEGEDNSGMVKLFEKDGKPTEFTSNALNFCAAVQGQHMLTRQFCAELKKLDLLMPQRSEIKFADGPTTRLDGFQMINAEKFFKLSDEAVLQLHKQGFLPLIHYALMSTTNWRRVLDMATRPAPRS